MPISARFSNPEVHQMRRLCRRLSDGCGAVREDGLPTYDHDCLHRCAQCIASAPTWPENRVETDATVFQEKLVETRRPLAEDRGAHRSDQCPAEHYDRVRLLAGGQSHDPPRPGFVGAYHPIRIDEESMRIVGEETFDSAHPGIPWKRQFSYAREIGF
jgi:hypothetical protein